MRTVAGATTLHHFSTFFSLSLSVSFAFLFNGALWTDASALSQALPHTHEREKGIEREEIEEEKRGITFRLFFLSLSPLSLSRAPTSHACGRLYSQTLMYIC